MILFLWNTIYGFAILMYGLDFIYETKFMNSFLWNWINGFAFLAKLDLWIFFFIYKTGLRIVFLWKWIHAIDLFDEARCMDLLLIVKLDLFVFMDLDLWMSTGFIDSLLFRKLDLWIHFLWNWIRELARGIQVFIKMDIFKRCHSWKTRYGDFFLGNWIYGLDLRNWNYGLAFWLNSIYGIAFIYETDFLFYGNDFIDSLFCRNWKYEFAVFCETWFMYSF